MDIDKELNKIDLQRITSFQYGVGEFFFDAITHLLKYYKFKTIRKNSLVHS
jgi:hypothetical protein